MSSLLSPKSVFTALAGLSVALASPVEPRQATETTSDSGAAVSTITGYAHPLSLTPLTTLGAEQTALSYDSPPTPITVPTRPAALDAAPAKATGIQDSVAAGDKALDATASVCTSIGGVYPTATVPNFCNPSALANAVDFLPARGNLPTATVTVGAVSNKLDCCVQCANIFNCVAWRFKPVYTQAPNAHLPGGFDPWGRGDCEAVYHTGNPDEEEADGVILVTTPRDETANLCPNGKVGEVLTGSDNGGSTNSSSHAASSWTNLYYNGWNEGPCAEPVAPFEGGEDAGKGDAANLCS
ncbi:hypothetical protein GGR52DRAFT_519938 [Hypoxylon sp. FL1284]|nr:hypothetical protein GGR52DRAFT_519938 [Hypoxylon sp. FL1284]